MSLGLKRLSAIQVFSLFFILLHTVSNSFSENHSGNKILSLRLYKIGDNIILKSVRILPGKAKLLRFPEQKYLQREFYWQALDHSSNALYNQPLQDPNTTHIHQENYSEDNDTLVFTVKLPYDDSIQEVTFFKNIPQPEINLLSKPGVIRRELTSISIPWDQLK